MSEWLSVMIDPLSSKWPDYLKVYWDDHDPRVYVPERVCVPHGEWDRLSHTQEVRRMYCDCGYWLGTDERESMPFNRTRLFKMPRFCPECGCCLVSKGRVVDE